MTKIRTNAKIIILFILLTSLFLTGCGKNESDSIQVREYTKTTTDLKITPDYTPKVYLMAMTDSLCYFVEKTLEEQQEESISHFKVYSKPLNSEEEPSVVTEIADATVLAFHLSKDTSGQDIVCVLARVEDKCVLTEYSPIGNVLKQFEVVDQDFVRANMGNILRCQDGTYVGYNAQIMYIFNDKGNVLSTIESPESYFRQGLVSENGDVYVTYLKQRGEESFLAKVDVKTGVLSEKTVVTGNVVFLCEDKEGQLFIIKDKELCRFDIATQKSEKVLDLAGYNIYEQDICAWDVADDSFHILSWEFGSEKAPVELIVLSPKSEEQIRLEKEAMKDTPLEKGKYDENGKRIITLYDPYEMSLDDVVENFNKNNDQYTVVVETGNGNIETRLASSDSPDLLFSLLGYSVENYQESGYLEDLTPYIEKSEILSMDDLQESVVNYFTFDGGLYALPQYCSIETLMCLKSQVGERTGWTVEEFFTWLKENPDVKSEGGLSKWNLLSYCLCGNMDCYVDFEQGTADLTGEKFKKLLEEIKSMKLDENGQMYSVNAECDTRGTHLFDGQVTRVRKVSELEYIFDEQLVNLGYPCDSGENKMLAFCTFNLSLLSRSECKEGAFAFMEHYLTYDHQWRVQEPEYEGVLWTLKSRWMADYEAANIYKVPYSESEGMVGYKEFEITGEHKEMVAEMLQNATPDSYEMLLIRDIIWEEAQSYFQNQKDLDTVCDIMQSRVSILLSERR